MHGQCVASSTVSIPDCGLVDFYESKGNAPAARWGHTAVVVNEKLYVFGGEGDQAYGDLHIFEPETSQWHTLKVSAMNGPPQLTGHAACSAGSQMYLYGGRQGRKVLHGLYQLCTESMTWQRCKDGSTTPPALAAHTLTAVGQHGILCFGGQGKRVYNAVHKLDPASCLWGQFKTIGAPPSPRHGHTAVWDTSDSLIVFGGINSTFQCLSDVHVLSLSTGYWSSPQCSGDIPRARANHAAVMWGPNLMLVFGGCDPKAAGRFMNDVFVLDIVTFTWYCLRIMGTPPAPRYWHAMVTLQGKAVVYGGSNATQSFDRLFSISSDWTRELESVAAELGRMSAGSNGRTQVPTANHLRSQFDGLLEQQAAAEALEVEVRKHQHTQALLVEKQQKLQMASAEVLQLQLVQDEQQGTHQRQIASLQDELSRLRHTHSRCASSWQAHKEEKQELKAQLKQREDQCAALTRHRDKHDALHQQHVLLQSTCQQLQQDLQAAQNELITRQHRAPPSQGLLSKSARVFNMQANSSVLDSCNHDEIGMQVTGAESALAGTHQIHSGRNKLLGEDTNNHEALLHLQHLAEQIAGLSLQQDELLTYALSGLHIVEDTLEHALSNVRAASRKSSSTEVSKLILSVNQMEQLLEEYKVCPQCMENDQELMLNCGHQLCSNCSNGQGRCPFCRTPITSRTRVFRA